MVHMMKGALIAAHVLYQKNVVIIKTWQYTLAHSGGESDETPCAVRFGVLLWAI